MKPHLITCFLQHQAELRQHLLGYVGCGDTAEDLLHDTFVRIAQLTSVDDIVNPRAFLYRVAGNLALDHLRRETRRQVWDAGPADEQWPCPCPQPDHVLQSQQRWQAIQQWLSSLPTDSGQILFACRVDGKTQRQIAAEMQVSQRHVEHILSRLEHSLQAIRPDAE